MVVYNINPEMIPIYRASLKNMVRKKADLKFRLKGRRDDVKYSAAIEYRIELLNIISGFYRIILRQYDRRLDFKN